MGMVFRFRALSDEDDLFARDYELRYDSDLWEFHRLVCGDLGFDPAEMASFFLSGPEWEKGHEFTSLPVGSGGEEGLPDPMEGTPLGNLVHKEKSRLIYTFDQFSGRSLFMELTGTYKEEAGAVYPRTVFSEGKAPVQFDMPGLTAGPGSIFDEALDEFAGFEGDDSYDDDL